MVCLYNIPLFDSLLDYYKFSTVFLLHARWATCCFFFKVAVQFNNTWGQTVYSTFVALISFCTHWNVYYRVEQDVIWYGFSLCWLILEYLLQADKKGHHKWHFQCWRYFTLQLWFDLSATECTTLMHDNDRVPTIKSHSMLCVNWNACLLTTVN